MITTNNVIDFTQYCDPSNVQHYTQHETHRDDLGSAIQNLINQLRQNVTLSKTASKIA